MKPYKNKKVIFDLDKTIWNCFDKHKNEIWAKQLVPPFTLESSGNVVDDVGNFCQLRSDVGYFVSEVNSRGIEISFLSVGARLNLPMEFQPSYLLLKKFGLLNFFQGDNKLLYKTARKINFLSDDIFYIFIDDSESVLSDLELKQNVLGIDAKNITTWMGLIKKVDNVLNKID